ncbi:MAG: SH3 domain-containing protein [Chloroflexi bacterium]|nr:SH3 domain-containing protein [Chloroflexota bacterium]
MDALAETAGLLERSRTRPTARGERRPTSPDTARLPAGAAAPDAQSVAGPKFINAAAEETHFLDQIDNPAIDERTQLSARAALAALYERRGRLSDAADLYERNLWAGDRSEETYISLASVYRQLDRDDLADDTLEQVRRLRTPRTPRAPVGVAGEVALTAARVPIAQPASGERSMSPGYSQASSFRESRREARSPRSGARPSRAEGQSQRNNVDTPNLVTTFHIAIEAVATALQEIVARVRSGEIVDRYRRTNRPGRRAPLWILAGVPIVAGVALLTAILLTVGRGAPAPTVVTQAPGPVATVAPTPEVAAKPPTPAPLVVANVGQNGLSLRKTPGAGERLGILPEGTKLEDQGESTQVDGKTWRRVREPAGTVGWVAAEYVATGDAAVAQAGPPAYSSGGLGLSRAAWEQSHGSPTRSSILQDYESGRFVIGFRDGNVWHMERVWAAQEAVPLDVARSEGRTLIPSDAQMVGTSERANGRIIDTYTSESLIGRFGPSSWDGGKPGTFSLQYRTRTADKLVTSILFRLGDALP